MVSIDALLLDERPIALSVNMQARAAMFTPKCTYDEAYRRFSPGFVLEYLVIEAFYQDDDVTEMDACTTSDGHVISGFWNEAKAIGTLVVGPDSWQTHLLARSAQATHAARERLKQCAAAVAVAALVEAPCRRASAAGRLAGAVGGGAGHRHYRRGALRRIVPGHHRRHYAAVVLALFGHGFFGLAAMTSDSDRCGIVFGRAIVAVAASRHTCGA